MDKIYYQPNHLWKGKATVKKLAELSGEKPRTVKQWLSRQAFWQVHLPARKRVDRYHYRVTIPNEMHQFDLLYMPSDTLYRNKCKYILAGIDAVSRYKVVGLLRTKLVRMGPDQWSPPKLHPLNRNKHLEVKIAELNKKIRRAKNGRNKRYLIAKRNVLRAELNWGPKQLEGAFSGANRRYRIDGLPGMDPDTFFTRIRRFLTDLLTKESRTGAVHSQSMTWIRYRKDREMIELAFNSRMSNVHNFSDMNEIVNVMITHMAQQIENLALSDSKFVFD